MIVKITQLKRFILDDVNVGTDQFETQGAGEGEEFGFIASNSNII